MNDILSRNSKLTLVWVVVVLAVIGAFFVSPVAQDPAYHQFADRRTWLGIPNCWNVLSNLPFVLVGLAGLSELTGRAPTGMLPEVGAAYRTFFAGLVLVGVGSGYYHLRPTDATLVWDRLPMTLSFMAFFAVILAEHISRPLGRKLLWPLIFAGIASVLYWYWTELAGKGDLRLYGLVQFLPMLLVPLILLLFPSRLSGTGYLWAVLGAYGLAKLAELADEDLFEALGGISGHAVKHLLGAAGGYCFLLAIRHRGPRVEASSPQ